MKRQILTIATVMTLALAGAALAQEPTPTTTNPNGQTTGYAAPAPMTPAPEPEMQTDQTMGATDTTTAQPSAIGRTDDQNDTMNSPEPAVAPTATPEVLESNREMDTTTTGTTSTPVGTTGTMGTTGTTGTTATYDSTASTDTADGTDTLPSTASDLPSLLLIGFLALGAAFGIHAYSTRRA